MSICRFSIFLATLMAPMPLSAQEKLTIPKEVRSAPGRLISIVASTEGKKVLWRVPEQVEYRLCPSGKDLTGVCLTPGRYTITAFTAIADEPIVADCVLIVEGPGPPAPGPVPPQPTPVPIDPLQVDLQRLYAEDRSPGKAETLARLASLYRVAGQAVQKDRIKTAGQLAEAIQTASTDLADDGLKPLRRRVGEELKKVLPTDPDQELTNDVRERAAKLFARLSTICEGIK